MSYLDSPFLSKASHICLNAIQFDGGKATSFDIYYFTEPFSISLYQLLFESQQRLCFELKCLLAKNIIQGLEALEENETWNKNFRPQNIVVRTPLPTKKDIEEMENAEENKESEKKLAFAKQINFGFQSPAELKSKGSKSSSPTELKEILKYCAPETLEKNMITKESNIYTLGLILYELFSEKKAFSDMNIEFLQSYNSNNIGFFWLHEVTGHRDLNECIISCLSYNSDKRPYLSNVMSQINQLHPNENEI